MPIQTTREVPKIWRIICAETSIEILLLAKKWKLLLAGLVSVYSWGCCSRGSLPTSPRTYKLQDTGFFNLPELGQDKAYISETMFSFIFCSFILWTFHPFVFQTKRIYTVLLWCRIFSYLVASQILRIITFYSTQLPGPNYHCREGSELARLRPLKSVLEVLLMNFPHGIMYGCGDLIFSSHMIFSLVSMRTYHRYGTNRNIKLFGWFLAIIHSLLIIASWKHYTVDIVVAWYTVNLVVFFIDKQLPELRDCSQGLTASHLLPISDKDRDSKNKEERIKFLNVETAD